jgi:hypothetical protein
MREDDDAGRAANDLRATRYPFYLDAKKRERATQRAAT